MSFNTDSRIRKEIRYDPSQDSIEFYDKTRDPLKWIEIDISIREDLIRHITENLISFTTEIEKIGCKYNPSSFWRVFNKEEIYAKKDEESLIQLDYKDEKNIYIEITKKWLSFHVDKYIPFFDLLNHVNNFLLALQSATEKKSHDEQKLTIILDSIAIRTCSSFQLAETFNNYFNFQTRFKNESKTDFGSFIYAFSEVNELTRINTKIELQTEKQKDTNKELKFVDIFLKSFLRETGTISLSDYKLTETLRSLWDAIKTQFVRLISETGQKYLTMTVFQPNAPEQEEPQEEWK